MTNDEAITRAEAVLSAAVERARVATLEDATEALFDASVAVQKLLAPFVVMQIDDED